MKTYFFWLIPFLFLGLITGCEIAKPEQPEDSNQHLFQKLNDQSRFVSPEKLADKIINADPEILLIDLREHAEFDAFTLPNTIHIPFNSLQDPASIQQMDCSRYKLVFLSHDGFLAEQAWYFQMMRGCSEAFILEGGLNNWTSSIVDPKKPDPNASLKDIERYNLQMAARQYFLGASTELELIPFQAGPKKNIQPKTIELKPKPSPKETQEEEGC